MPFDVIEAALDDGPHCPVQRVMLRFTIWAVRFDQRLQNGLTCIVSNQTLFPITQPAGEDHALGRTGPNYRTFGDISVMATRLWHGKRRVQFVLQHEAAECGLACIAMVASFYKHYTTLADLRKQHAVSSYGQTLRSLLKAGASVGLHGRAVKVSIMQVKSLSCPAILHWDLNHFVVLETCKDKFFYIMDPARGRLKLLLEDLSEHFTGIAVEFRPSASFKSMDISQKMSYRAIIGTCLGGEWRLIMQALLLAIASQVMALLIPAFVRYEFGHVGKHNDNLSLVLSLFTITIVILAMFVTELGRTSALVELGARIDRTWSLALMSHLNRLPLVFFQRRDQGQILTQIQSITKVREMVADRGVLIVIDSLIAALILVGMFITSPVLTVTASLPLGIYFTIRLLLVRSQHFSNVEYVYALAKETEHLLETVKSAQAIKLYRGEEIRTSIWQNNHERLLSTTIQQERLHQITRASGQYLSLCGYAFTTAVGVVLVKDGGTSTAGLISFLIYSQYFRDRAIDAVNRGFDIFAQRVHVQRVAEILTHPLEDEYPRQIKQNGIKNINSIRLADIQFSYGAGDNPILREVNLEMHAGDYIAIVGPSGSGKSTLLKLITGLYTATAGDIIVNGNILEKAEILSYRSHIAAVMQDDDLLSGSLADNICFFDPDMAYDKVTAAAKLASIHDEILKLPSGYDTMMMTGSNALSSGQKQRVLLARAFYRNPEVIILDETTANLDSVRESAVTACLSSMDAIRIVVSHRPEPIRAAKRIFEIQNGTLIEKPKTDDYCC